MSDNAFRNGLWFDAQIPACMYEDEQLQGLLKGLSRVLNTP
jgi:hypothetical protein